MPYEESRLEELRRLVKRLEGDVVFAMSQGSKELFHSNMLGWSSAASQPSVMLLTPGSCPSCPAAPARAHKCSGRVGTSTWSSTIPAGGRSSLRTRCSPCRTRSSRTNTGNRHPRARRWCCSVSPTPGGRATAVGGNAATRICARSCCHWCPRSPPPTSTPARAWPAGRERVGALRHPGLPGRLGRPPRAGDGPVRAVHRHQAVQVVR